MSAFVLFSAVKNEGPFLLEWIAYHKAIGFDRIAIVSNPSDDGTNEILDALAAAGEILHEIRSVPEGVAPQAVAAEVANDRAWVQDGDWAIWLDGDEFLNIHAGKGTVLDLAARIGKAQGMLIPWRLFGDGGHARFPGRFVSDGFTGAAAMDSPHNLKVKTFFRKSPAVEGFSGHAIHRPRLHPGAGLGLDAFLSPAGGALDKGFSAHRGWLQGRERSRTSRIPAGEIGYGIAQINHYSVRTPEFFRLKAARGRGWKAGANTRHTPAFYREMNLNEVRDDTILRHAKATTKGIAALMAKPGVAAAAEAVAARTAALLAREEAVPMAAAVSVAPDAAPAVAASAPGATATAPKKAPALTLPPDEARLLCEVYAGARSILEYGSGGSTVVASALPGADVFSVESDAAWAAMMTGWFAANPPEARVRLHHADIGETRAWGRPATTRSFRNWPDYPISVWDRGDFVQPEVVLIDGRFRLACFLTVLFRARRPTTILWDDYAGRDRYHPAETLARPVSLTGRMARFDIVPQPFPPEAIGLLARACLDPE